MSQFRESALNNCRHSDGFFVAASPSPKNHACCGRYIEFGLLITGKGASLLINDGKLPKLLMFRVNLD